MGWAEMKASKAIKPGQWSCGGCYVINEEGIIECVSCETAKPGCEAEVKAAKAAAAASLFSKPAGGFSFGVGAGAAAVPAADGGGKRQKAAAPASTSISVTINGDGKLGLVFVAGSEPPVVKAVSADGLAANAAGLKVGLVLTHVQGAAVASMSHDEAKGLIKDATRPLVLVFIKKDAASSSNGYKFPAPAAAAAPAAAGAFVFRQGTAPATAPTSTMDVDGEGREAREPATFQAGITPGSVLVSGSGDCGQLGLGMKHSDLNAPHHLSILDRKNIVKITCGGMHTVSTQPYSFMAFAFWNSPDRLLVVPAHRRRCWRSLDLGLQR